MPPPHVQIPSVFLYAYHITVHGVVNIAADLLKSDDTGTAKETASRQSIREHLNVCDRDTPNPQSVRKKNQAGAAAPQNQHHYLV